MEAAKGNRWGHRDATMVLVAYRHSLRVSELVDLRWEQVDFRTATLHVRRVRKGTPSTHPILGDELRALRRLQREQEPRSPFVFTSERGAPFTTAGFARMVERAGSEAKLGFKAHPHMLRHACGYALANRGHDTRALQAYLGHRNIQHTVRYSELAPTTSGGVNGPRTSEGSDFALTKLSGGAGSQSPREFARPTDAFRGRSLLRRRNIHFPLSGMRCSDQQAGLEAQHREPHLLPFGALPPRGEFFRQQPKKILRRHITDVVSKGQLVRNKRQPPRRTAALRSCPSRWAACELVCI